MLLVLRLRIEKACQFVLSDVFWLIIVLNFSNLILFLNQKRLQISFCFPTSFKFTGSRDQKSAATIF